DLPEPGEPVANLGVGGKQQDRPLADLAQLQGKRQTRVVGGVVQLESETPGRFQPIAVDAAPFLVRTVVLVGKALAYLAGLRLDSVARFEREAHLSGSFNVIGGRELAIGGR